MHIIPTKDAEIIAKLNQHIHELHVELYPYRFKDYDFYSIKQFFVKIIDDPRYIFLLLEDNGKKLGYAWLEVKAYQETVFTKSYPSIFVHQISITPTAQNKGYGGRMMEEIYAIARQKEIDLVELDYWCKNTNAANFYEKQGFAKYRAFVFKNV